MTASAWSSVDHYENFPVASWLVPAALRPAVVAIYRFAREADDLADEGDLSEGERLTGLARLAEALRHPAAGGGGEPASIAALRQPIAEHRLPVAELLKLLDAFAQDVRTRRYAGREALLDYCSRSANPVGRLLLRLFDADDPVNIDHSDRICTALQLINFVQDVAIDWQKGRVYLPQDTLEAEGSSDADIGSAVACGTATAPLLRAIATETTFARQLIRSGRPLLRRVPLRLSLELRAVLAGGERILDRIEHARHDVFRHRPTIGWRDAPSLLRLALAPAR